MVESFLKPTIDCPCGCGAHGMPAKKTGHPRTCVDTCPTCARPKAKQRSGDTALLRQSKRQVAVRSQGMCEARILEVCTGVYELAHHKRRRGQGGSDHVGNLLAVDEACHAWIHANPQKAMDLGFLIGTSAGPVPSSTAVLNVQKVKR